MSPESCGSCRYLSTDNVCRRYPPTPLVVQQQSSMAMAKGAKPGAQPVMIISALQTSSGFPVMDPNLGWCGEWTTKETMQ